MKRRLSLILILSICVFKSYSQDSIPVKISTDIFYGTNDEWIHLKISDTLTNNVVYDSLATVTFLDGFKDTLYLDSGVYKCEIIDMGANTNMPNIILDNGDTVIWGYPDYEYYLFTLPFSDITNNINEVKFSQSFRLYPNPTSARVFLRMSIPDNERVVVTLRTLKGEMVSTQTVIGGSQQKEIDLTHVTKGIYLATFQTKYKTITKKLVVL